MEGLVPAFAHTLAKTEWELDTLRFEMCVKQSDIDVMTFASDLRPPFMVISPEFAMVSV